MEPDYINQPSGLKRFIRIAILVALGVALLWAVIFIAGHGRLSIQNFNDWDSVFIQNGESSSDQKTFIKDSSLIVRNGYFLITFTKDNSVYATRINAGGWLKKTTIRPSMPEQARADKLANNTRGLHVLSNGTIYTMDSGATTDRVEVQAPVSTLPFVRNTLKKLPGSFTPMTTYGNSFIGTIVSNSGVRLARYEPASNSLRVLSNKAIQADKLTIFIGSRDNSGFVYYDGGSFYYLKDLSSSPTVLNVSKDSFDTGGKGLVAAFTGDRLYLYTDPVASGIDTTSEDSSSNSTKKRKGDETFKISSFDVINNRPGLTISLKAKGKEVAVSSMTASPANKYFGLLTNQGSLNIYDSADGRPVTTFIIKSFNAFFWQNDTNIITLDADAGIQKLDIQNQSTSPVFASKTLKYSGLEKRKNKLYLTARVKPVKYQKKYAFNSRLELSPVLYGINLGQTVNNKAVVNNLPYITNDYTLDFLNNNIFFIPTTGDINDPVFANKNAYKKEVDKRIEAAKTYLELNNIPESKVRFFKDIKLNLKLFWAPGS